MLDSGTDVGAVLASEEVSMVRLWELSMVSVVVFVVEEGAMVASLVSIELVSSMAVEVVTYTVLPWLIVVVTSSLFVSLDGAGAEELAREDDAVIGEFSVVLSVGTPPLELLKPAEEVEAYIVVLSMTVLLDSEPEDVGTLIVVLSMTVLLDSGTSEVSEDGAAEELAIEDDAVVGEFSVVLSVTTTTLELLAYVGT